MAEKDDELIGKWCGCIMMVCAAVYLLISFICKYLNVSWIVFPIGGILCGIVSIILSKEEHSCKRACYFTFNYKSRSCIDIHKVENTHHLWHIDKYATGEQWLTCCISFKKRKEHFYKTAEHSM